MKKLIVLLFVLAILVCMCACQKTPQTNKPDPTTGTQTATQQTDPKPTETQPTEPVDPMIAEFQDLLGKMGTTINNALLSIYNTPADVDLYYLFYNGFADESQEPTEDELVLLEKAGAGKFWPEMDLIRLPVEKMDAALMELFGITFEQTNGVGLDKLVYLAETNCYYTAHTGMEYADIAVDAVKILPEGYIVVLYSEPVNGRVQVVLKPVEGGGYHILANNHIKYGELY